MSAHIGFRRPKCLANRLPMRMLLKEQKHLVNPAQKRALRILKVGSNGVTVHWHSVMPVGASLLANPTVSREILTLGTVRTIREQARSYPIQRSW
jgi:hypothetical protein